MYEFAKTNLKKYMQLMNQICFVETDSKKQVPVYDKKKSDGIFSPSDSLKTSKNSVFLRVFL
jgi:hypothetical protein